MPQPNGAGLRGGYSTTDGCFKKGMLLVFWSFHYTTEDTAQKRETERGAQLLMA